MPFLGPYPYGTPGGQDTNPDQTGSVVAQGIGQGINFAMVTDAAPVTIPIPAATILQRIYGTVPISGIVTSVGGENMTIIVDLNGNPISSTATTLNFVNSFNVTDSPAGTENITVLLGSSGVANSVARSDHTHSTQAPLFGRSTRDEVTNGQFSLTSTTGTTVLSTGFTMPNDGLSYVLKATAWGVCYSANNIWIGVAINGTDIYYSGNIQSGPEHRQAIGWVTVTGSGQAVTAWCRAKVDTGSGLVGSAGIVLEGIPFPFTH